MYKDNRTINNTLLDFVLNEKITDLRKYGHSPLNLNISPFSCTHTVNLSSPRVTCKPASAPGAFWKHTNEIWCDLYLEHTLPSPSLGVCLCLRLLPQQKRLVRASGGEPLPRLKRFSPHIAVFCSLRGDKALRSDPPYSLEPDTRSDFLLWITATLTRIVCWHQPLQNNKHVMQSFLGSYHKEQNLQVPLALPG